VKRRHKEVIEEKVKIERDIVPLTEIILTLFLETLSGLDLITDILIMRELIYSEHPAWFTLSLFMMMSPFLMGYGSMVTLKNE